MFRETLAGLAVAVFVAGNGLAADRVPPDPAKVKNLFGNLPLYFIENQGQIDSDDVTFYVTGSDKTLYFTPKGITFSLHGEDQRWTVKLDFVGAAAVKPVGADKQQAVFSYFKGKPEDWTTGLPTYGKIVYEDLWPGIDLVYTGSVNRLKYEFVVEPGADPENICLAYRGITEAAVEESGALKIATPAGCIDDGVPYAYQHVEGQRQDVAMRYRLAAAAADDEICYSFEIGEYDARERLVLDPSMLLYCGYIGGSDHDSGRRIAVDGEGNAYVTGGTDSSEAQGFPVLVGPDLTSSGFEDDAFVAKVSASGASLVYCGYIGGSDSDWGAGIAVDSQGNAYIAGNTDSNEAEGFPVLVGPDLTFNGEYGADAFVAKVSASGASLVYCGYIGGSDSDWGAGIALDGQANAYVTGGTESSESEGFPVLVGPDLTFNGGEYDAFAAKVSASGASLVYCGYIGGSHYDGGGGAGIAVDVEGNAYVMGETRSSEAQGFPVLVGPDLSFNGVIDAFVAKVSASGASLVYCGYIGGSGDDGGAADIAVDSEGNACVTGWTLSSEAQSFPVLVGPDLTYNGGYGDGFVAKVSASGASLVYCGYIGGSDHDEGRGIAVDGQGDAYVTGYTESSQVEGAPILVGPDLTFNGGGDAFVAKVSESGASLAYYGYIGGLDYDYGCGIAVDGQGNAYVTGYTRSSRAEGFPVLVGPDLTHNGDIYDAFVAKLPAKHILLRAGNVVTEVYKPDPCDVLFLNGTAGDDAYRTIVNPPGTPVTIGMAVPAGGPDPAGFVLYAWSGEAGPNDPAAQPYDIGTACFPMPLSNSAPWRPPLTIANSIGFPYVLGVPQLPNVPKAPTYIVKNKLLNPGTWTFQGIIFDSYSGGPGVSLTNAIVLIQQ